MNNIIGICRFHKNVANYDRWPTLQVLLYLQTACTGAVGQCLNATAQPRVCDVLPFVVWSQGIRFPESSPNFSSRTDACTAIVFHQLLHNSTSTLNLLKPTDYFMHQQV
jgi:hypothetical protein